MHVTCTLAMSSPPTSPVTLLKALNMNMRHLLGRGNYRRNH
jgi:hypothetical protein